jgi:hypothetical protein
MTVTIDVTAKDIEKGYQGSCTACPVALAVMRHLKPGLFPSVGSAVRIHMFGDYVGHCRGFALTPLVAISFMGDFDAGIKVSPFSFTLDLPEEVLAA